MPELEIGLVDGGELNFNQTFLKFHVKKKKYRRRVILDLTLNPEYLSSKSIAIIMPT